MSLPVGAKHNRETQFHTFKYIIMIVIIVTNFIFVIIPPQISYISLADYSTHINLNTPTASIPSSIHYLPLLLLNSGSFGHWSLSQLSGGEAVLAPWTRWQFFTGPHKAHRTICTPTLRTIWSFQQACRVCLWTAGGEAGVHSNTCRHRANMQSPYRKAQGIKAMTFSLGGATATHCTTISLASARICPISRHAAHNNTHNQTIAV